MAKDMDADGYSIANDYGGTGRTNPPSELDDDLALGSAQLDPDPCLGVGCLTPRGRSRGDGVPRSSARTECLLRADAPNRS